MTEIATEYIVVPLVSALIGGIGWLVKRYFAGRDADKAEIKQDIANLKSDLKATNRRVNDIAGIIIGCEHPDCPSRKILADYMSKETKSE